VSQFQYHNLEQALRDFNIVIENIEPLLQKPARPGIGDLWSVIDPPDPHHSYATNLGELQANDIRITLPFEVRYQLEVCISHGLLNEHNIDALFLRRLADMSSQDVAKARNLLEWVDKEHTRIYNPMSIFQNKDAMSASYTTRAPHYCAYSRKATVTPSTIYFNSPTVETTNRVLRHYARENSEGRFLRVQFTDERGAGRINACAEKARNDELFTRVYRTLHNGIQIGNRHYEFLAFGNSQFRENGAYFFCPTDHLSCNDIRQWMGNFSNIKVVAKYAARLGQCFSTTRAINSLSKPDLVRIADEVVKFETKSRTKEYNFTDGVGKISPFLAQMVAAELGIPSSTAPSAFQFRLGGCKGILVVWPEAKEREVHIRESQEKFPAIYNGLEIIRCAKFSVATLNRQTITILSSLGVPNKVFIDLLVDQLASYQSAMSDDELAVSLLLRYIDENGMTINIATMIRNGFMAKKDPFVLSLLHLWRSWSIKLLKEKAKIIVENGAFLLGCVDETNTLKGYKSSSIARGAQNLEEDLPEIFIQVPDKKDSNKYTVVKGICLVGRNPSLHPGDLRLVRAVDIKALHHLRDVVVFPRNGDRDIPSMCSGGDLDGDDYFVIWDKALLPREWNCDPMNYDAPKTRNLRRPVEIVDLMKFFVRFMKNDSLSAIAHAHLALSDYLEDGVKDERCLELAALHSKAVDYVKTGEPAQMPKRLRPPKWPHFMEKKFKPKEAQYHSTKILGQLYDKVETINFVPQYEEPFDQRILEAYVLDEDLLKSVRQVKRQYDTAVRRLMTQQDINTEFEIWSTFVLSKPRVGSDYKLQEEIGRLSEAIKKQFRGVCEEKAGGKAFDVLGPFVAGMYKVTKEELDIALAECRTTRVVEGREVPKRKMEPRFMPLISFPWLFEKELGRIATGVEGYGNPQNYGLTSLTPQELNQSRKQQDRMGATDLEDSIQPEYGITGHHAEELDLFRQDDSDDYFNSGGSDDTHYMGNDYDFIIGDKEEATSYSGFQPEPDPAPGHSLDGDSDTDEGEVVPRI
jgi:RNA-dependent RNA polymerase